MRVRIYTTRWCGFCLGAKALLEERGVAYEEVPLDGEPAFRRTLFDLTGGWTVPQVLVDGRRIGGYAELRELDRRGLLEELRAA